MFKSILFELFSPVYVHDKILLLLKIRYPGLKVNVEEELVKYKVCYSYYMLLIAFFARYKQKD